LRQVIDIYRLDLEDGSPADDLAAWVQKIHPSFDYKPYGFQSFAEFLNFAQDNFLVRVEADEAKGLMVFPGAELQPVAAAAGAAQSSSAIEEPAAAPEAEQEPAAKPRRTTRKRAAASTTKKAASSSGSTVRRPRARKPVE
jgi:hypothetical protein